MEPILENNHEDLETGKALYKVLDQITPDDSHFIFVSWLHESAKESSDDLDKMIVVSDDKNNPTLSATVLCELLLANLMKMGMSYGYALDTLGAMVKGRKEALEE